VKTPTNRTWYCSKCGAENSLPLNSCRLCKAARPRRFPDNRLARMSRAQLLDTLGQIVDLWFLDLDGTREFYSLDKDLDADHLERVTQVLADAGLAPAPRKEEP